MKNLILITLVLISVKSFGQTYQVNKSFTFLLDGISKPRNTIMPIPEGETVQLIEKTTEEYFKVSYSGKEGFIPKKNIVEALPINPESNKAEFTAVVEVPNVSKDELYIRAKQWIATVFKSANAVIQMDDKAEGILIGKGISRAVSSPKSAIFYAFNFGYTIKIYLKDGRYKYLITDITHGPGTSTVYTTSTFEPVEPYFKKKGLNAALTQEMATLENSLSNAMAKPSTGEKDW